MNAPDNRDLIEGLLSDEAARHAPGEAAVLGLVRRPARRALGLAAVAGLVLFLSRHEAPESARPEVAVPAPPPVPVPEAVEEPASEPVVASARIPRVTDEEMLDFLGDAPVALVTRSDGSRALIMLTGAP